MPTKNGKRLMGREALVRVSRTTFGQEQEEDKYIEIRPFATDPALVSVGLHRTINLGNYESAKVSVQVTVPCYREEVPRMYPAVFKYVADRITEEAGRIINGGKRNAPPEVSVEEML